MLLSLGLWVLVVAILPVRAAEGRAAAVWGAVKYLPAQPGDSNFRQWNGEVVAKDLTAVAVGPLHCVGLRADGTVVMWGLEYEPAPAVYWIPPGLNRVRAVACGGFFSAALKDDGSVVTWGYLGSPPSAPIESAQAMAAGWGHLLILKDDGTVAALGGNDAGQINVPQGLSNVVAIAAGGLFSAALKADGRVAVWGQVYNSHVPPDSLSDVVQLASSSLSLLALRADGTVVPLSGSREIRTVPQNLLDVVSLSVSDLNAVAIKSDGTVVVWGYSGSKVPPGLNEVSAAAVGNSIAIARRRDGTLAAWNLHDGSEVSLPDSMAHGGVTSIQIHDGSGSFTDCVVALGLQSSAGILRQPSPQTVHLWQGARFEPTYRGFGLSYRWKKDGKNIPGGIAPTLFVEGVGIGDSHRFYGNYTVTVRDLSGQEVTTDPVPLTILFSIEPGTLVEWSPKGGHQRQTPTEIQGKVLSAATGDVSAVLLDDGSVGIWSAGTPFVQRPPSGLVRVSSIASGYWVGTLDTENTVTVMDYLGRADWVVPESLSRNVQSIAVNSVQLAALRNDGTVEHWKLDNPVRTVPVSNIHSVAVGGHFLVLLKGDGTVVVDGAESLGAPPGLDSVVAVAAGAGHCVALKADGSVVAWGANDAGQCDVPGNLGHITAIAAGSYHTVALQEDGTVMSWGKVAVDVIAGFPLVPARVPVGLSGVTAIAAGGHNTMAILGTRQVPALTLVPTPDGLVSIWPGNPSSLTLVGTDRLHGGTWNPVSSPVIQKGTWNQAVLPASQDTRFLRLVAP